MPITPKSPSALLRSLGADESALEARIKASAREAEQRWPLFRTLTPSEAELAPELNDSDKQAWEQPIAPPQASRKQTLSRPGLSSKISGGLDKFVKTGATAKVTKTAKTPSRSEDQPVAVAVRSRSKVLPQSTDQNALLPEPPSAASQVGPTVPAKGGRIFPTDKPAVSAPPKNNGLFAAKAQIAEPTDAITAGVRRGKTLSERPSEPSATDSLADLFGRVEGKVATKPSTRSPASSSSVMRRIGKR